MLKPKFVELDQQSSEWLAWRSRGIGGSDAPVIMGVSPWMTRYQLWERKTGRTESGAANAAMRRGIELEADARMAYENATGEVMEPHCLTSGLFEWMRASLDGINLSGSLILEIKCPGKDDHAEAVAGRVPEKYMPQLQHNLAVSGAKVCHYWSFDGDAGVLVTVSRDDLYITALVEAERAFWSLVETDTAPPLNEQDVIERRDEAWLNASALWLAASRALESAREHEDAARTSLLALADSKSCIGAGVRVTHYYKSGNVDYKAIPELRGVDLEKYRKKGRFEDKVTAVKEK